MHTTSDKESFGNVRQMLLSLLEQTEQQAESEAQVVLQRANAQAREIVSGAHAHAREILVEAETTASQLDDQLSHVAVQLEGLRSTLAAARYRVSQPSNAGADPQEWRSAPIAPEPAADVYGASYPESEEALPSASASSAPREEVQTEKWWTDPARAYPTDASSSQSHPTMADDQAAPSGYLSYDYGIPAEADAESRKQEPAAEPEEREHESFVNGEANQLQASAVRSHQEVVGSAQESPPPTGNSQDTLRALRAALEALSRPKTPPDAA